MRTIKNLQLLWIFRRNIENATSLSGILLK
nr:MAG TPA: hypothetical protein [Caudoviricetes sp.]